MYDARLSAEGDSVVVKENGGALALEFVQHKVIGRRSYE